MSLSVQLPGSTSGRAEGDLLLKHWDPEVRAVIIPVTSRTGGVPFQQRLSLHVVSVLLVLKPEVGRPGAGAGCACSMALESTLPQMGVRRQCHGGSTDHRGTPFSENKERTTDTYNINDSPQHQAETEKPERKLFCVTPLLWSPGRGNTRVQERKSDSGRLGLSRNHSQV